MRGNGKDTQTISQMLEYAVVWACIAKMAARFGDAATQSRFAGFGRVYERLFATRPPLVVGEDIDRFGPKITQRMCKACDSTLSEVFHVDHVRPWRYVL